MVHAYHTGTPDKPHFNPLGFMRRSMAFDNGALDATLAAAAGDDAALMKELRAAFLESAARQLDLLKRARCDGNWNVAAMRLRGLAASFHAEDLLQAADRALNAAPGEPMAVREIEGVLARFSRTSRR